MAAPNTWWFEPDHPCGDFINDDVSQILYIEDDLSITPVILQQPGASSSPPRNTSSKPSSSHSTSTKSPVKTLKEVTVSTGERVRDLASTTQKSISKSINAVSKKIFMHINQSSSESRSPVDGSSPSSTSRQSNTNESPSSSSPRRSLTETIANISKRWSEQTRRTSTDTRSSSETSRESYRHYTVRELIASLGQQDVELPPALERRVRDFKFAQNKRRERHGDNQPWGIFGLYAHLSDIRADLEWAEDAAWRRQRGEPYLSWADFERTRDKGLHNRPWFTYGVIFLCTIMLFVTLGVNGWRFEPLKVNPLIGPSSETLVKCGARQTSLIVNEGQWYRLFSPLILHAGLIHYVINMLAMWYIGAAVEQSHGSASTAVLFIIPAVGGNILSAICLPQYISVGASGGIFGLIGGCLADITINWNLLFLKSTAGEDARCRHFMVLFWLGFDVIVNCMIGLTPFVDNFTHLGGFLYGLCCGLSTLEKLGVGFFGLSSGKYSKFRNNFMRFFGLIISVIFIMATTIILVQSDGVTSPCHGCRYVSCVPFPPGTEQKWWYCDDCDFVTAELFLVADGSGLYQEIDLQCPDGTSEMISIAQDNHTSKDSVRKALPNYCRKNCEDVFADNN